MCKTGPMHPPATGEMQQRIKKSPRVGKRGGCGDCADRSEFTEHPPVSDRRYGQAKLLARNMGDLGLPLAAFVQVVDEVAEIPPDRRGQAVFLEQAADIIHCSGRNSVGKSAIPQFVKGVIGVG